MCLLLLLVKRLLPLLLLLATVFGLLALVLGALLFLLALLFGALPRFRRRPVLGPSGLGRNAHSNHDGDCHRPVLQCHRHIVPASPLYHNAVHVMAAAGGAFQE